MSTGSEISERDPASAIRFCEWHSDCFSSCHGATKGMVKITVVESSGNEVRLRVEGRLTGRSAEELRNACDLQALSDGIPLTLDLADVSFADAEGIEVLRE